MSVRENSHAHPGHEIERSWLKANVIGAVVNGVIGFAVFALARTLGVNEAGTGKILAGVFAILCVGGISFGMMVFGYLVGVVLRQKLAAFPMRSWVSLYVGFGVVLGVYSAYAMMLPDPPTSDRNDNDLFVSVVIGAAILGAMLGGLSGSLQALLLGQAARGVGAWVAYSALAGTTLVILMPIAMFGPQDVVLNEILVEGASFLVTVTGALIMLPAVLRLEPL
jgi:hypothetical protein